VDMSKPRAEPLTGIPAAGGSHEPSRVAYPRPASVSFGGGSDQGFRMKGRREWGVWGVGGAAGSGGTGVLG
jgi:hypothetical protein